MMERLAGNWTAKKLQALTRTQRADLLDNTRCSDRVSEEQRTALIKAIEESGAHHRTTGLADADPLTLSIHRIINSAEGLAACIDAAERGLPALAGVDPLLVAQLGDSYATTYHATATAGDFVAKLMQQQGYIKGPSRKLPAGSAAKTAAMWMREP